MWQIAANIRESIGTRHAIQMTSWTTTTSTTWYLRVRGSPHHTYWGGPRSIRIPHPLWPKASETNAKQGISAHRINEMDFVRSYDKYVGKFYFASQTLCLARLLATEVTVWVEATFLFLQITWFLESQSFQIIHTRTGTCKIRYSEGVLIASRSRINTDANHLWPRRRTQNRYLRQYVIVYLRKCIPPEVSVSKWVIFNTKKPGKEQKARQRWLCCTTDNCALIVGYCDN